MHRSTPSGQHRPVMLEEVLNILQIQPGQVVLDCTIGWAGHAVELLHRAGPQGRLIGIDRDAEHLPAAQDRLTATGFPFQLHHGNFAGLASILAQENLTGVHGLVADLGMSSMQVDDPERGFSYARDGLLDMRMDRSRGQTAAELLATIPEADLAQALAELGDEPEAATIAAAIVRARALRPILTTRDLAEVIRSATGASAWRLHPAPNRWIIHPAARTFQAVRILLNRELANLEQLLRVLPDLLLPGGKAAIISFHSGEDRRVKGAFREGARRGVYARVAPDPVRATWPERTSNPRARSAKLRWAERG